MALSQSGGVEWCLHGGDYAYYSKQAMTLELYFHSKKASSTDSFHAKGEARLSTPGGQERKISILPYSSTLSFSFLQFFSISFVNMVLQLGSSPTQEGPGYTTVSCILLTVNQDY